MRWNSNLSLFLAQNVTGIFNINPNKTRTSGSCTPQLVTLELHSENISLLVFQFGMVGVTVPFPRGDLVVRPACILVCGSLWFS